MYTYPGDTKDNYLYYCSSKGHGLTKDFQLPNPGDNYVDSPGLAGHIYIVYSILYTSMCDVYSIHIKAITYRNTLV